MTLPFGGGAPPKTSPPRTISLAGKPVLKPGPGKRWDSDVEDMKRKLSADNEPFLSPAMPPTQPKALLHGHDVRITEEACVGILKGLAEELSSGSSGTEKFDDELDRRDFIGDSGTDGTDISTGSSNAAMVDGVWKSDGSRHTIEGPQKKEAGSKFSIVVEARGDLPTIRVAYFFSGIERKASIGNKLKGLCVKHGYGLKFEEIDILVGGKAHDLLDKDSQEAYIQDIEDGKIDVQILSPPCGTWSRANWANDLKPQPCRDRTHPWGFPNQKRQQQQRAETGNEFVHFAIRALAAGEEAKSRGHRIRSLLEHPEDLGRTPRGTPASIWQLPELRKIGNKVVAESRGGGFKTVGGNQCQFPGVDRKKPTRLLSDIRGVERFGVVGWPKFDAGGWYAGPIPKDCGHRNHKQQMIGKNAKGGFNTAPTAAYPEAMCEFIAGIIFVDWVDSLDCESPCGGGVPVESKARTAPKATLTPRARSAQETTGTGSAKSCAWDAPLRDPPGSVRGIITEEEIRKESDRVDGLGIHRPIKDELEIADFAPKVKVIEGDKTSEEETELNGKKRPKKGAGWWGHGHTMLPLRKGIPKPFTDGAGLCSPGRWPIDRRRLPSNDIAMELQQILLKALFDFEADLKKNKQMDLRHVLLKTAVGKMTEQPFPKEMIAMLRSRLRDALVRAGYDAGLPRDGDTEQEFEVRLIQSLLEAFADPDAYFCDWWAVGVWLGSMSRKLPRTPAVFERKTKWKFQEPAEDDRGDWQRNYSSVAEHVHLVEKQFREEEAEKLMARMKLRDALAEFGEDLMIAATGAIEKKGRTDEVRVIFDGSHGITLNPGIRVRDQVRYPTASDGRAILEECAEEGGPHFSLHYDVSKAHRRVPVLRCEWGRQACQVSGSAAAAAQTLARKSADEERKSFETHGQAGSQEKARFPQASDFPEEVLEETIWLNCVGTFGVGSAGYWWGRAGACVIRLTHYLQGHDHAIWTMLYSDDGWLVGRTKRYEVGLLLHLLILVVIGAPLAWHKLCGGVETEWVGYALDVGRFEIGISEKRAQWVIRWCNDKVRERQVRLGELREGLGRLQFLAGPLEHLRPFLAPLYAWSCAGARFAKPKLPVMLLLILKYLAAELQKGRMSQCRSRAKDLGETFRLDAKAEGENVAIGGWRCRPGRPTREAEWFAVTLNRRNAPWAFSRGEAFRTIASLELLGALVSVMVLLPVAEVRTPTIGLATMTCGTDNQGNSYLLDKLMTTKFPLGVVLMELACQLGLRRACLHARWIPRLQNEEADALTNGDFHHFDMKLRIPVNLEDLGFVVMNELFAEGETYVAELAELKEAEKMKKRKGSDGTQTEKARKGPTLREREPWG